MSVIDLARATNLSRAYIHSLEKSDPSRPARQPTAGVLVDLAKALSLSIADVLSAAGIDVADIATPIDPGASRLIDAAQKDTDLRRLFTAWTALTAQDRATIADAAEDLARLRAYLAETAQAAGAT